VIGETLGHYRIETPLGAGGMGAVYRAYDLRLQRRVAIKLLHEDTSNSPGRRLLHEARNASRLSHPGVCTVHEIAEHGDRTFIVMELVPGRRLADVIPADGLPTETLLEYAIQVADALAHAHDRGVLHRDLKSVNVMVQPDGRTKILDFGIAEIMDIGTDAATRSVERSNEQPLLCGTLHYLAPEILNGQPADQRSDIWSFGVLLYELAAGRQPFTGQTAYAVTSAIINAQPPPLSSRVPSALARVIAKSLAKDPAARYSSVREALAVLESLRHSDSRRGTAASPARAIAVLPFKDLVRSADDEHLGLGLADAIITELAGVKSLLVRPTSAIVRYRDAADPRAAGRDLAVDAIVEGNFQRVGSRLRVTVQLTDVADGRSLWGTRLTTSLNDLFALQDEIARHVASALQVELTEAHQNRLGKAIQASSAGYEQYLRGRVRLLVESRAAALEAVGAFERATAIDPQFAPAWAGLSDACLRVAFTWEPEMEWYERAERACSRALELDPELPEGRQARGRLLWTPQRGFKHAEAMRALASALDAKPSLNEAHEWLGLILLHVGLMQESEVHFNHAMAIAPDDLFAALHLGLCKYLVGDFESSRRMSEDIRKRDPETHWIHYQLTMCHIQLGDLDAAQKALAFWSDAVPGDVLHLPVAGILAALRGDQAAAERHVAATVAARRSFGHYHHAQYDLGCINAVLGRSGEAIRWVADAARNGFPCSAFFRKDPLLENLHADPAFGALMDSLDAQCGEYEALYQSLLPAHTLDDNKV
jgi:TolB-like protein